MFSCSTRNEMSWKLGKISQYTGQWEALDLEISEVLKAFGEGRVDARNVVSAILTKLFNSDFSGSGKHWSHDGQSISLRIEESNDDVQVYDMEESSTWDWKDIYAVAQTTGVIEINKATSTITIKTYRFYCSG